MTPVVFVLATIGVSYTSWLLMRFIVWLDTPKDKLDTIEELSRRYNRCLTGTTTGEETAAIVLWIS